MIYLFTDTSCGSPAHIFYSMNDMSVYQIFWLTGYRKHLMTPHEEHGADLYVSMIDFSKYNKDNNKIYKRKHCYKNEEDYDDVAKEIILSKLILGI